MAEPGRVGSVRVPVRSDQPIDQISMSRCVWSGLTASGPIDPFGPTSRLRANALQPPGPAGSSSPASGSKSSIVLLCIGTGKAQVTGELVLRVAPRYHCHH